MLKGTSTMAPDSDSALFFVKWWQEILSGLIVILTGLFLKAKGKSADSVIVPLSEAEIEHRMLICKQSILIAIHSELEKRDAKLFHHIELQDEKIINHIKDMMRK